MKDSDISFLSKRAFNTFILPNILGVECLSKVEVRKDIKEIENSIQYDSDSEDSVRSEDIIPSSYPVKPRRTPKIITKPVKSTGYNAEENDHETRDSGFEDSLECLRLIETSRHDIFFAEKEREKLEIQYHSLRDTFISTTKRIRREKQEQENFLSVIQSLYLKNLHILYLYQQQNVMVNESLKLLKYRNNTIDFMKNQIVEISNIIAKYKHTNGKEVPVLNETDVTSHLGANLEETPFLRVTIRSRVQNQDPHTEIIYKGQCVNTPYGPGIISYIRTKTQSIAIRLSFGEMFSSLRTMLSWYSPISTNNMKQTTLHLSRTTQLNHTNPGHPSLSVNSGMVLDRNSDEGTLHRWLTYQKQLQLSDSLSHDIALTVNGIHRNTTSGSATGLGMLTVQTWSSQSAIDGDATDNDDDQSIAESMMEMDVDNSITDPSATNSVSESPALGAHYPLMEENGTAAGGAVSSTGMHSSPRLHAVPPSHMVSRSQSMRNAQLPPLSLPSALTPTKARMVLSSASSKIEWSREQLQLPVGHESLPLAFAPPGAMPNLVHIAIHGKTPSAVFFKQSLTTWYDGATDRSPDLQKTAELQNRFEALQSQIFEMEQRQIFAIKQVSQPSNVHKVENVRRRIAQLVQDMTMTRLSMFSRRVRHSALVQNSIRTGYSVPAPVLATLPAPVNMKPISAPNPANTQPVEHLLSKTTSQKTSQTSNESQKSIQNDQNHNNQDPEVLSTTDGDMASSYSQGHALGQSRSSNKSSGTVNRSLSRSTTDSSASSANSQSNKTKVAAANTTATQAQGNNNFEGAEEKPSKDMAALSTNRSKMRTRRRGEEADLEEESVNTNATMPSNTVSVSASTGNIITEMTITEEKSAQLVTEAVENESTNTKKKPAKRSRRQ